MTEASPLDWISIPNIEHHTTTRDPTKIVSCRQTSIYSQTSFAAKGSSLPWQQWGCSCFPTKCHMQGQLLEEGIRTVEKLLARCRISIKTLTLTPILIRCCWQSRPSCGCLDLCGSLRTGLLSHKWAIVWIFRNADIDLVTSGLQRWTLCKQHPLLRHITSIRTDTGGWGG